MATTDAPRTVWRGILSWLLPSFDETTLFLMAVTCMLLIVVPSGLRGDLEFVIRSDGGWWFGALLGWAAIGLAFSVYHAFARRRKSILEKTSMAVFAMVTNVAAGLLVGFGRLNGRIEGGRWLAVVNIGAAILLLYEIAMEQDLVIADDNASPLDLIIGLLALAALFAYFELIRRLPWPLTFALCIAYATLVHRKAVWIARETRARVFARRSA